MEVNVKKTFVRKVTYDAKLDNIEKVVKSHVKEEKFNEMVDKLGEDKIKAIISFQVVQWNGKFKNRIQQN